MNAVKNLDILRALRNHEEGEVIRVEEENKNYIYHEDGWYPVDEEASTEEGIKLTVYDLNKQLVGQQPDLTEEQIITGKQEMRKFIDSHGKYFMMLCKELSYYTVFIKDPLEFEDMTDAIVDCLTSIGNIKMIYPVEGGSAVCLWVASGNDVFMLYFFPYDEGVIVCQ